MDCFTKFLNQIFTLIWFVLKMKISLLKTKMKTAECLHSQVNTRPNHSVFIKQEHLDLVRAMSPRNVSRKG